LIASKSQAYLDLADWRRRVGDLYRIDGSDALARFRRGRDELFRTHPQSPLSADARARFVGLRYFDPDPSYVINCRLDSVEDDEPFDIDTGGEDGVLRYRRAGLIRFAIDGRDCQLAAFSLIGYGGGLFLPFRDLTSGKETYGGGRYLFDTAKNTDGHSLVFEPGSPDVTIDFNFAYNPSCAYDARWACPLASQENWLRVAIRAGEKIFE
jgi:uncharacterized protein